MAYRRLLERFFQPEAPTAEGDPIRILVGSIGSYLSRLLNTREGNALIAPGFGLPDVTPLVQSYDGENIRELEDTLASVIASYEPRLKDVRVEHSAEADTPFTIAFSLSGKIRYGDSTVPVIFETVLAADGHIEIRGHV